MITVCGKNGAGKSTLSKLLCGFMRPQEGLIRLNGTDLKSLSVKEIASHIGYVMQNPNQMITKPMIKDEVALGLVMEGKKSGEEIEKAVNEALEVCGLYSYRNWPVSALSYGQKKRVTIASIISIEPEILILDEPTAGQDYRHYTDIMEFLSALNKMGVTIILITHDMHLMIEYSSRSLVFTDGALIEDSTPEKVLTNESVTESASLKKTSLSDLARMCSIDETAFIRQFIEYERKIRREQSL